MCCCWIFEQVANPITPGWTNPNVFAMLNSQSAIAGTLAAVTGTNMITRPDGGLNQGGGFTYEGYGSVNSPTSLAAATGIGTAVNTFDGTWPVLPLGYALSQASSGRLGNIVDLWAKPTSIADADSFPNDPANRQFVAMGGLVYPWDGSANPPLLT